MKEVRSCWIWELEKHLNSVIALEVFASASEYLAARPLRRCKRRIEWLSSGKYALTALELSLSPHFVNFNLRYIILHYLLLLDVVASLTMADILTQLQTCLDQVNLSYTQRRANLI